MICEATTNYKKQALQDIIDFISGKIQESEFLQKYKVNATKSHDYVDIVSDVLHSNHVYDAKFAQSVDMQETDFEPLKRAGANYAAEKLVRALFSIAYTRKPNNRIGGDGKPESYDRQRNIGPVALVALRTLGSIPENSVAADYVYNEYFFPRIIEGYRRTNMLSPSSIFEQIRKDAKLTEADNVKLASSSKNMQM